MAAAKTQVGSNVSYSVSGDTLTVTVDLSQVADAPLPVRRCVRSLTRVASLSYRAWRLTARIFG